jgi:CO/xanthine dehydrogenase Mo-binding subunit
MRAPGTFGLESTMDEAAKRLGIDPVELRVRNFADRDQDAGRPWSCNTLLECYHVGANSAGGGGPSKARPAVEGGGSVGAWRARCIPRSGKVRASAWYPMRRCWSSAARRTWLAHLFGARLDCGQRIGHSDVEGSRRAGRYMVAGRSLFQVARK